MADQKPRELAPEEVVGVLKDMLLHGRFDCQGKSFLLMEQAVNQACGAVIGQGAVEDTKKDFDPRTTPFAEQLKREQENAGRTGVNG